MRLHRLCPLLLIAAHGNRPVVIGGQRLLIDVGHAVGVDFIQLHGERRVHRVIGDEAAAGAGFDSPQFGFGEITAQARAVLDHSGQRIAGRQPAPDRHVRQQITHAAGLRCAQQKALALCRQPTVFGDRFCQPLLDNAGVGSGFAATGLAAHQQLLNLDFPTHDRQSRFEVR